jgi:short-subunit dehydrogenase
MNIIITGATHGIGKAIAIALAKDGHNLSICARGEQDLLDFKAALLFINPNIQIHTYTADLSIQSQVQNYGLSALSSLGKIDVLVNNAGTYMGGELLNEEEGQLDKMLQTNLMSAYHLTRVIAPEMINNNKGIIINMCSIASVNAYANGGAYSISKFALYGFSKNLREELKDKNIKVMSILPGATWSKSWAGVDLPKDRIMEAEDIAKIVVTALHLSDTAVIEDIVLRPQLGDL